MRHVVLAAGAAVVLAGCAAPDPDPVEVAPEPEAAAPQAPPPHEGLYTAWERVFDLPLPAGVTMEAWDTHLQHYRSRADWDDLMAFYDRELEAGYSVLFFERGVRIEPANARGRSVYLYRERHGEGVMLTYVNDPIAAAATPAAATPEGERPPSLAEMMAEGVPADQVRQTVTPPTRTYTELLEERFGDPTAAPGGGEAPNPEPIGVRLDNERRPESFRRPDGSQRPITFVRGVREERRNPDALF